jgi:hypothetical protein
MGGFDWTIARESLWAPTLWNPCGSFFKQFDSSACSTNFDRNLLLDMSPRSISIRRSKSLGIENPVTDTFLIFQQVEMFIT